MALVVALSFELMKNGHQVDVICIDRPSGSAHEAAWVDWLAQWGIGISFLGRKPGDAGIAAAAKLWCLVQHRQYDVLHSHLPMPDAISGLVRRLSPHRFAHVVTMHNTHEPRISILKILASGANVAYCSEAVRQRNSLSGISSTVIPNGIALNLSAWPTKSRAAMRQEIGMDGSAKVVIAVGRLCPQKNFVESVKAMGFLKSHNTIPNVKLLVCGDGEDKIWLENSVRELGLTEVVRFMGNRTDVFNLLAASDVFLSTSNHEGMPLSVLEALSAGLPCVLSAIQEHYELAESMPGCTFVPHAPEAIASALEVALDQPTASDVLRRERAPLLQKHSIHRCAGLYEDLYHACCHPDLVLHPSSR
ncbi:MAG: glycosyltransferase [Terracidiphilus sp.]|nr:glycosyltransferase [Terracidiphilus sp.]